MLTKGAATFLTVIVTALVIMMAPDLPAPPHPAEVECSHESNAHNQYCRALSGIGRTFNRIVEVVEENDETILAAATIAIAWFTFVLWQSTHFLWLASKGQAHDMQRSIAEAGRAASAMERVADASVENIRLVTENSVAFRDAGAKQIRAYLSVVVGSGLYQDQTYRFEVNPTLINTGQTPAHKVAYWATAEILPRPVPDNFAFSKPEKESPLSRAFVLGPHQSIILNAAVPDRIPDEEVQVVKFGLGKSVYIWGVVTYEDVFGVAHYTNFCHTILWETIPGGERIRGYYASRHNEAD